MWDSSLEFAVIDGFIKTSSRRGIRIFCLKINKWRQKQQKSLLLFFWSPPCSLTCFRRLLGGRERIQDKKGLARGISISLRSLATWLFLNSTSQYLSLCFYEVSFWCLIILILWSPIWSGKSTWPNSQVVITELYCTDVSRAAVEAPAHWVTAHTAVLSFQSQISQYRKIFSTESGCHPCENMLYFQVDPMGQINCTALLMSVMLPQVWIWPHCSKANGHFLGGGFFFFNESGS